jgi:hypothetical protein
MKKEFVMKKRWIIIIVLVLLLASFTIYQFVNSNSAPVIDMMQAQMATNSSIDRGPIEHALGVDTPFYWKPEGQSTTCLHVGECKEEVFISFFKLFLPNFRSSEA